MQNNVTKQDLLNAIKSTNSIVLKWLEEGVDVRYIDTRQIRSVFNQYFCRYCIRDKVDFKRLKKYLYISVEDLQIKYISFSFADTNKPYTRFNHWGIIDATKQLTEQDYINCQVKIDIDYFYDKDKQIKTKTDQLIDIDLSEIRKIKFL